MDIEDFGQERLADIEALGLDDGIYEAVQTFPAGMGQGKGRKLTNRYVFRLSGGPGNVHRVEMLASHFWCSPTGDSTPGQDVSDLLARPCRFHKVSAAALPGFLWMENVYPHMERVLKAGVV